MPESENALWAKTRRRNMAANRRRTGRSESAAERARKAARRFLFTAFAPRRAQKSAPAGALFLKGHHKFALWNDTIALRLKNRVAPLFGGGAPKSVGGAKNGFVMRFFALQPFL